MSVETFTCRQIALLNGKMSSDRTNIAVNINLLSSFIDEEV
jgi:hypothetical protein